MKLQQLLDLSLLLLNLLLLLLKLLLNLRRRVLRLVIRSRRIRWRGIRLVIGLITIVRGRSITWSSRRRSHRRHVTWSWRGGSSLLERKKKENKSS